MRFPRVLQRFVVRSGLAIAIVAMVAGSAVANDWYVDQSAPPGGDGSAAHPFQKIGDGLSNAGNGDRILVANGTYSELLSVTNSVTIVGDPAGGTTVAVTNTGPVITIASGTNVWLQDLVVRGGVSTRGGGISNLGTTVLVRCRITSCGAFSYYALTAGGGIDNGGTMLMWSCSVDACNVTALYDFFTGRSGGPPLGGGIYNYGTLKVFSSTLSGNVAKADGTFVGGGAAGGAVYNTGELRLVNTTVSGNEAAARDGYGGGIANAGGYLLLDHSTITRNDASGHYPLIGTGSAAGGGIDGDADVGHSVISDNVIYYDYRGYGTGYGPDFYGTCNSLGYLLIRDPTDTTLIGDLTGVQTHVDPKLLPLADNGGPVLTHALDPTSPCIDAGNPDPLASPAYDARGYPRALWDPATGACDLGAYESGGSISFLLTATPDVPLAAGATVALVTGGGIYTHPNLLVLVDVNGAPTFAPVVLNSFDQSGVIVIMGAVPNGLSGTTAGLKSWSFDANGKVEISNEALLTFQ